MFEEHPSFIPPTNKDQKIWRYLDFTKFVDLLNTQSLYFTRADLFEDKFEGSLTKPTVDMRTAGDLKSIKEGTLSPIYTQDFMANYAIRSRTKKAINCWHMNDYESAAMWKLYIKSNEGIAIQSTYNRLVKSFKNSKESIQVGSIKYIDYESDLIDFTNGFNPFLHKRKSFEHERELRAIIWEEDYINNKFMDLKNGGWKVKIDLNSLIENVFVSPDSPIWFTELVQDITKKFGLSYSVVNSRLRDKPIF